MRRFLGALALALATALVASTASASATFPATLRTKLALATAPACALCHRSTDAAAGPADTLFGKALVARGLVSRDDGSLERAVDRLRAEGVDSDGDGAQDLDEVTWGRDPNTPDVPEGGVTEPPTYGCSCKDAAGRPTSPGSLATIAVALLLAFRRAATPAQRSRAERR